MESFVSKCNDTELPDPRFITSDPLQTVQTDLGRCGVAHVDVSLDGEGEGQPVGRRVEYLGINNEN